MLLISTRRVVNQGALLVFFSGGEYWRQDENKDGCFLTNSMADRALHAGDTEFFYTGLEAVADCRNLATSNFSTQLVVCGLPTFW